MMLPTGSWQKAIRNINPQEITAGTQRCMTFTLIFFTLLKDLIIHQWICTFLSKN